MRSLFALLAIASFATTEHADDCARKVGEEGVEAAVAALGESDERVLDEIADLWFHSYVLLAARGLDVAQVEAVLTGRHAASYR